MPLAHFVTPAGARARRRRFARGGVGGGLAAGLAAVLAACGSLSAAELPPAAGPAVSPPLAGAPEGRIVRVGAAPEGVAVDGVTRVAAVALRDPPALALVDARSGRTLRTVPLSASARHVALAAPGGPVLVPAGGTGRLVEVTLPEGRATPAAAGSHPHDAVSAGGRVFVSDERGNAVTVLQGGRPTARIPVALRPGGLARAGRGRAVAVLSVRERMLEVLDADTLERTDRAAAGTGPAHVVSDGRNVLYVADTAGDALLVFRLRPRLQLTRRVYLAGAPYGLAYDARLGRVWATLTATNRVTELSGGSRPRILRSFAAVRQPDSVAVEVRTGRVFVTGRADGVLQLFDPPPFRSRRK